jgi:site-specific recombinase XerD
MIDTIMLEEEYGMYLSKREIERLAACLRAEERSEATIQKYCREAAKFAAWLGGRPASGELARAYKESLRNNRTPSGVNGAAAALNRLFVLLGKPEWRMKAVKVQRQAFRDEARELTRDEYRRLLAAAEARGNRRLLLLMETVCSTGIRISELRFFTVEAVRRGRADVTNKGKTRAVFLPRKLQKLLLQYAKERRIAAGPVFVTRNGRPMDRSNIWHDMKTLCKAAHVAEGKVFPHNLRHLFARTYYGLEKDIVRLADILGHANVNTTRIYTMETGDVYRKHLERLRLVT